MKVCNDQKCKKCKNCILLTTIINVSSINASTNTQNTRSLLSKSNDNNKLNEINLINPSLRLRLTTSQKRTLLGAGGNNEPGICGKVMNMISSVFSGDGSSGDEGKGTNFSNVVSDPSTATSDSTTDGGNNGPRKVAIENTDQLKNAMEEFGCEKQVISDVISEKAGEIFAELQQGQMDVNDILSSICERPV